MFLGFGSFLLLLFYLAVLSGSVNCYLMTITIGPGRLFGQENSFFIFDNYFIYTAGTLKLITDSCNAPRFGFFKFGSICQQIVDEYG